MSILRDNPLRPALANHDNTQVRELLRTRLDDNVICYTIPKNASRETVLDVAFACALACTSETASLSQRKNLVVTYTNILIDGIIQRLSRVTVKTSRITPENLSKLRDLFTKFDEKDKPDDYTYPQDAFDNFNIDGDLPQMKPGSTCDNITYSRREKSLYAHLSLVIFLAGKKIEDINRTIITIARPKVLIEKYRIPGTATLNGPAMISKHAYLEMTTFTGECFEEFSGYTTSNTNLYQDILNFNVTLL
ncbi:hypothetical protein Golomagni_01692 [Golovinomyces magnicellulatus]|nr:hypothetical protein Golomagni_01692 [Golovinomyces magnicellulatus]